MPLRSLPTMASSEDSTMAAIRCVAFSGQQRLISRRREGAEARHHAQVFRVEAATCVMGDDPDRADGFALDVEGNQQAFLKNRLDSVPNRGSPVRDVSTPAPRSVKDRAARAEVARRSAVDVRSPLPGDRAPMEVALLVAVLQEAEPGRVRAAQGKGGVRELLQNSVGRRRHLPRQSDQRVVLGRMVGRTRRASAQFRRGEHRRQLG